MFDQNNRKVLSIPVPRMCTLCSNYQRNEYLSGIYGLQPHLPTLGSMMFWGFVLFWLFWVYFGHFSGLTSDSMLRNYS